MSGHGEKLTRRQEQAIACLLAEVTVERAARSARVGVATLGRWLKVPSFQQAYREARRQVVEAAVANLQRSAEGAAITLGLALTADRAGDRIKAACAILDRAVRGVELIDIIARLDALEAQRGNGAKPG
jgi:hypothetical protein